MAGLVINSRMEKDRVIERGENRRAREEHLEVKVENEKKEHAVGPKRGSFEAVMDILQGQAKLKQAKEALRGDFLAKSSRAAQKTKIWPKRAWGKEDKSSHSS